jgi:hypothetical protein
MKLLKAAMVVSACLYILDAWIWSLPVASTLLFVLSLPCFAVAAIVCLFRKYRRPALNVMGCVGIFLLGFAALVGTLHLRKTLLERRAVKIGDACLAYRAKYNRYPERLDQLVPEYFSSVPPARYGILSGEDFSYSADDGPQPFLYYECLPPFGNCYYYIECDCWDSRD